MIEVCQIGYTEISISRSPPPQDERPEPRQTSQVSLTCPLRSSTGDGWVGWTADRGSDVITSNWFIIWRNDRVICLTIDLLFINVNLCIYCIRSCLVVVNSPLANTFFMLLRWLVQFQRLCRNWNWHSSRLRLIPFIITSRRRVLFRQMSCKLSWLLLLIVNDACGWCGGGCCCCCCLLRLHTRTGSRMTLLPSTLEEINK